MPIGRQNLGVGKSAAIKNSNFYAFSGVVAKKMDKIVAHYPNCACNCNELHNNLIIDLVIAH